MQPTENLASDKIEEIKEDKKKERKKNKRVFKPEFIQKAQEIYNKLLQEPDQRKIIFYQSSKVAVPEGHSLIKQRAQYIGVSKNGRNWQSLIVIKNTKVYLGTYKTQGEAAAMFDFHSILVKFQKARVNNAYSVADVIRMLKNFFANDNEFNARKFVNNL